MITNDWSGHNCFVGRLIHQADNLLYVLLIFQPWCLIIIGLLLDLFFHIKNTASIWFLSNTVTLCFQCSLFAILSTFLVFYGDTYYSLYCRVFKYDSLFCSVRHAKRSASLMKRIYWCGRYLWKSKCIYASAFVNNLYHHYITSLYFWAVRTHSSRLPHCCRKIIYFLSVRGWWKTQVFCMDTVFCVQLPLVLLSTWLRNGRFIVSCALLLHTKFLHHTLSLWLLLV